ncbi:MAG: VOC family protein [Anaerolineae bacterium]|nr:VOC family protein [Anaerolineae bacterium]
MKFNALVPELSVSNFSKSLDFYTRILGFSVAYDRPEEGFAFLVLGEAQLMLDQIGDGRTWQTAALDFPLGRGINFEIEVDSIQPLLTRLQENNIPLFLPPEEKWYRVDDYESGNRQFLVQDPDGYLLRFTEDIGQRPFE